MPKAICVINMKGGVGKTTVAVNLAWYATIKGKRTLLVDLDPQFNASVYLMGERNYLGHVNSGGLTVFDIFEEFSPMRDPQRPRPSAATVIYQNVPRPWSATAPLHIIPSQLEVASTLKNPAGKAHLLSAFLQREAKDYDLIVVDPPPTDSMATEAAYLSCNYVLVPVKPEFLSSIGFPLLARSISNFRQMYPQHSLQVVGMVLNNFRTGDPEYDPTKQATQNFANQQNWPLLIQEMKFSRSYLKGSRRGSAIFDTGYVRWDVANNFKQLAQTVLTNVGVLP